MKVMLGERWREKELGIEGVLIALTEDPYRGWHGTLSVPDREDPNQSKDYPFPMSRMERVKGQPKAPLTKRAGGRHKLKFGQMYTEVIHDAKGKLMHRTEYLTGCERVGLQYVRARDGEVLQFVCDESVLKEVPPPPKSKPRPKGPATTYGSLAQTPSTSSLSL